MGILDGTHIAIYIPTTKWKPYRNWKRYLSQNVLPIYNFDMKFIYRFAGWETSVYDGWVFHNAIEIKGFWILVSKYCIGNAGYSNLDDLLILYKGV